MNKLVMGIHITCGALLLLMGLIQIIRKKGDNGHRKLGQWYVLLMLAVCGTAVFISIIEIMDKQSFGHLFLLVIALFTQYALISGFLLGRFKSNRNLFLGKIVVLYGWLNVALLAFLTIFFWVNFGWICLVFCFFQCLGAWEDTKFYWFNNPMKRHGDQFWLYTHSGRMLGSYIGAVTAFLVNVVDCDYPLVLWLGPTIIGTALIMWFNKKMKK